MDHINRRDVSIDLRDAGGKTIWDDVIVKFYNQRALSLNQSFTVAFRGKPGDLPGVPAAPFGLAEVFISPGKYRCKSIFFSVPSGRKARIEETMFVEPDKVQPVFPSFTAISSMKRWAELWRILQDSGITTAASWKGLGDLKRAGLLNLVAKMQREVTGETDRLTVMGLVQRIVSFQPARILAEVDLSLLDRVRSYPVGFHSVPGTLHKFPAGWTLVSLNGSFKTHDKAGNLQVTFAQNNGGRLLADIDIDDHQGVEHAADVLKHRVTGRDTHPYDIHDILIYFQGLDPGYVLN